MWITPALVKLSLILIGVFAVSATLIRAQPYDDSELRNFLNQPCAMPCWGGIRLGATDLDTALALLSGTPGVENVQRRAGSRHIWRWGGDHPTAISGTEPQYLLSWRADVAETLSLQTLPELWKFWLILGRPDRVTVALMSEGQILYIASYESEQIHIFNSVTCAAGSAESVWVSRSRLDIGRLVYYPIARPVSYGGISFQSIFHRHPFC